MGWIWVVAGGSSQKGKVGERRTRCTKVLDRPMGRRHVEKGDGMMRRWDRVMSALIR